MTKFPLHVLYVNIHMYVFYMRARSQDVHTVKNIWAVCYERAE